MESSMIRALAMMRREGGVALAFGGAVAPDAPDFAITRVCGPDSGALRGLLIRSGEGLGGKARASARLITAADYLSEPDITHPYDPAVAAEGLRSIAAVPVVVGGLVRAVLYAAVRTPTPLTGPRLAVLYGIARHMAFDLAVSDEVDRRLRTRETQALLAAEPRGGTLAGVRRADAQLRELSDSVDDPRLRARLQQILAELAPPSAAAAAPVLSAREREVLALAAIGCTNPDIAVRLGLQRETVKSYLRGAMRKLGAHTRTEAVTRARAQGTLP